MEDIIYYASLLSCVILGSYYKKIEDLETKRNYGAGLGLLVTFLICGRYVIHSIFLVWGNVIIIKCCDKRLVHQVSLLFTWIYLTYMHYIVGCAKYFVWVNQTIALRMVGLAFEVNVADKPKNDLKPTSSTLKISNEEDNLKMMLKLSAVDMISYAFFFIGLHKGPYYRWKTFNDHFQTPFSGLGDCRIITEHKIKKAFLCLLGYWLLQMQYPVDMYTDYKFYESYGTDYRFISNLPHLIKYFFEYQIIMMLCTGVCTETGFGVYPAKCLPIPGFGPTTQFSLLKLTKNETDVALQQEYNFSMLKCFDYPKLIMGPRMRDTVRAWDMSTRYWFWAYIYKDFVKSNKVVRSACSFLVWTIWVGPSKQLAIMSLTLWVYIHLETEYAILYNTTGSMKSAWDVGFSIMRILCLIYLTPCLVINDTAAAIKYYNSIYWVFHIVLLVLTFAAVILYKSSLNAAVLTAPKQGRISTVPGLENTAARMRKESVASSTVDTASTAGGGQKRAPDNAEEPSTSANAGGQK